jgi:endonuclease/exonuclease/phosphatase family metal-dependent hydrolase
MPRHVRRPGFRLGAAVASAALLAACAPMPNLLNPSSPRFEGHYAGSAPGGVSPAPSLRVVTFNIKFAREIDRAIEVLESDSLRDADVLMLQEMDDRGVDRIARALGLNYAYYPATVHPGNGRYFGPAVLSRWPIERSWKVLLPHEGWGRRQRRTATAALVRAHGVSVLAYAVHLETPLRLSESGRRDQAMAVMQDAAGHAGPVVIAGDFNSQAIGPVFQAQGYRWATRRVGPTVSVFSWDHIFARGVLPREASAGMVREVNGASDHRPVWAVLSPASAVAAAP